MKVIRIIVIVFVTLWGAQPSFSAQQTVSEQPSEVELSKNGAFTSPAVEARAVSLFREIKCPICVAQSVAESDAIISKDLRKHIRREIIAGKTDQQILETLALRYGDSILLNPRIEVSTIPLWIAPWFFLILGLYVWRQSHKRQKKMPNS